jgi:K+ transporter
MTGGRQRSAQLPRLGGAPKRAFSASLSSSTLTVGSPNEPRVRPSVFRVLARVGFMQTPNVPELLARCEQRGIRTNPMSTTYYLGRETLLTTGRARMARLRKHLFSFLSRNSRPPSAFFSLPPNRVVELGTQIEL